MSLVNQYFMIKVHNFIAYIWLDFTEALNLSTELVTQYIRNLQISGHWKWIALGSSGDNTRNRKCTSPEASVQHFWWKPCMLCRRACSASSY